MSRRPYVHLAGDVWGCPLGFAPQVSHLRALDQYASELVDGEGGGTWAPEEPIVLGPWANPGVSLTTVGSVLSGDVETVDDNDLGVEGGKPGLVLQSGAVPAFQTPRARIVTVPFTNCVEAETTLYPDARVLVDPLTCGATLRSSMSNARILSVPLPIRAQHRGATIAQVDFRFIVAGPPTSPGVNIRVRVARVMGDTLASLHTSSSGAYDGNGWLEDMPATTFDYTNNGQVRTLSFVPDQNHTNLDPGSSWFLVQARPSSNMGLGSCFLSATVFLTNITDYRQE